MRRRHALIVCHDFPPVGGIGVQRPLKFAKYLGDFGWQVTVLTADHVYSATLDPSLVEEIPASVRVIRVADPISMLLARMSGRWQEPSGAQGGKRGMGPEAAATSGPKGAPPADALRQPTWKRVAWRLWKGAQRHALIPDESVVWAIRAGWVARRLMRREAIDCLYTTSGPHSTQLAGLIATIATGAPWIADFRDPWTDNLHFHHSGWRAAIERQLERMVFRRASAIVTVTDGFWKLFAAKYPSRALDIHVIRNGVDEADFPPAPEPEAEPVGRRPFTFFYAGILYPGRSADALFHAVHRLLENGRVAPSQIRLQFAGVLDYPGHDHHARLIRELGLEDVVEPLGYLPRREALSRMLAADANLLIGDQAAQAKDYVPGKLYEYLFAGRPILAMLREGEAADFVRREQAGVVVPPDDPAAIAEAMLRLMTQPAPARRALPAAYSRRAQAQALAQLMEDLMAARTVPEAWTMSWDG
ncbi:glycosyltransferase family 4 protein [Alicyclobacillus vulcanalis]|uniref:Glycosyltransferase involved in cell wall bisynthesis n=1 Tax=Alicyclobacillus vulcanalis TaxID=252246 RepID=A0A1N7MB74_9BACL|nr:glycosyltransferase family 4 protein [Alicyclobacillus vulcanalis]SIS83229.1 Glycosyltransferase involved in cell wall bisynthesis [Alicyclobacillus vulcanalis]